MSREEIEKLANEFSPMMFADVLRYWGEDAAQALTALLAENERLREALAPFAEASRLAKIGGYPPYQFIKAGDYGNAEAALNKDPDQ